MLTLHFLYHLTNPFYDSNLICCFIFVSKLEHLWNWIDCSTVNIVVKLFVHFQYLWAIGSSNIWSIFSAKRQFSFLSIIFSRKALEKLTSKMLSISFSSAFFTALSMSKSWRTSEILEKNVRIKKNYTFWKPSNCL